MTAGHALDPNVVAAIPKVAEILDVTMINTSPWAKAMLVKVRLVNDTEECYFMKVCMTALIRKPSWVG